MGQGKGLLNFLDFRDWYREVDDMKTVMEMKHVFITFREKISRRILEVSER